MIRSLIISDPSQRARAYQCCSSKDLSRGGQHGKVLAER
jgi:hypothetical protein